MESIIPIVLGGVIAWIILSYFCDSQSWWDILGASEDEKITYYQSRDETERTLQKNRRFLEEARQQKSRTRFELRSKFCKGNPAYGEHVFVFWRSGDPDIGFGQKCRKCGYTKTDGWVGMPRTHYSCSASWEDDD